MYVSITISAQKVTCELLIATEISYHE